MPFFNLKTTTYTLLLICTVCLFVHCAAAQRTDTNNLLSTIVIDAGHGGKDPGTEGKNSQEKNVTLAVALKLGKLVREAYPNLKVVFTRETDEFIELNQRTAIANECKADLFISIHCNAAGSTAAVGTETFVMGLHTSKSNLEVAQRENSVISYEADYSTKYEGYDPKSPESFMIFSLMQNVFLDQSLELATGIQGQFTSSLQRFDRGVKQAGFLVLYKSSMPSVLIELGFLSNNAGGILGGISSGAQIVLKSHFKPTPSIFKEQKTLNLAGEVVDFELRGRHDPCIGIRGSVVATAMIRLVIADMLLLNASTKLENLKKIYK